MKRVLLVLFNILIIVEAHSQQNAIKVDVLGPFIAVRRMGISYERSILKNETISLQFSLEGGEYGPEKVYTESYTASWRGFIPEIRFYPFGKELQDPSGPFIGGAFRYMKFTETISSYFARQKTNAGKIYNAGLNFGYKARYKRVCIELLVGAGTGMIKFDDEEVANYFPSEITDSFFIDGSKAFYRAEISIGYVFPRNIKNDKANPTN